MATDLQAAGAFYGTPTGCVAARMVQARLELLWPQLAGQTVLGLGYAGPYLSSWAATARGCIAAILADADSAPRPLSCCLVEEDALPFPDLSVDRVLLVHGLRTRRTPGVCCGRCGGCCATMAAY